MKNNVKKVVFTCSVFLLLLGNLLQAATGFYVKNGKLYDANDNEFVMRGVSHAHTWYTNRTSAFADIKSVGANTVRVVLSSGKHGEGWIRNDAADVRNVIELCKANKLVAMLECHDTTGYPEKAGATPLTTALTYWRDIQSVLTGQEDYVLINIGNEPYGNIDAANWVNDTLSAIQAMRSAGFQHTLVVDAPNWGQDWEQIMLANARKIYTADSTGNLILSIHMYGVYEKDATIKNYISTIRSQNLPLIIGEFGWDHSDGNPDEDAIMYRAVEYNIGYIGWSWCGNGGGVEYLDMVSGWDVTNLTNWGKRIVNGANGLRSTSFECTIYGGNPHGPLTPEPTPPPPSAGSCAGVPVWTAEGVYAQTGTRVQYNNMVYENKWYSKAQNPEEFSDEFEVWTFIGMCADGGSTLPPVTPTPVVTATHTPTPSSPTPVSVSPGDVNNDGSVTILDALMTAQYYVGLNPVGFLVQRADVNCDGQITIVDALVIAQYYVGLLTSITC